MADRVNGGAGVDGLEERLSAAARARREQEIVGQRCRELDRRISEAESRRTACGAALSADQRDVERLTDLTLTRVLARMAGRLDSRLAREEAEVAAAQLRVQEANTWIDTLRGEHDVATARLRTLADVAAGYESLLDEKEALIHRLDDGRSWRLLALAAERGRLSGVYQELTEVAEAAAKAGRALDLVARQLDQADLWSFFDRTGGGMIVSEIKVDHMDDAAMTAAHADRCLLRLRTELADLHITGAVPMLRLDDLTRFTDLWLDNWFTDRNVGARIQAARNNVARSGQWAGDLEGNLRQAAATASTRLATLEAEREALLASAPVTPPPPPPPAP